MCVPQAQVLYQRPENLIVLYYILDVARTDAPSGQGALMPTVCRSRSSTFGIRPPNPPITTGTTLDFISQDVKSIPCSIFSL